MQWNVKEMDNETLLFLKYNENDKFWFAFLLKRTQEKLEKTCDTKTYCRTNSQKFKCE